MDIKINDDAIDVKDIMRQIKENLSSRNMNDDLLRTARVRKSTYSTEIESELYSLNKKWHNTAEFPITSHRKGIGNLIVFYKKLVRKLLRWYINPTIERQVEFNASNVRALNLMLEKIDTQSKQIDLLTAEVEKIRAELDSDKISTKDFDYFAFEELYRGSRELVKERQKRYLTYFKSGDNVLDLGCGRGEFTELLLENNIQVTCVDLNVDMVELCRDKGLPIVQDDIINYLKRAEDNTFDGIFLGHVVEHLSLKQLIELVGLAHKKIKTGGLFIAETPNPQCLSVFAQSFYLDPTHIKPVHPYTIKFMVESAGFTGAELQYFTPNDDALRMPELKFNNMDEEQQQKFNEVMTHWNNIIFGNQDYCILGKK